MRRHKHSRNARKPIPVFSTEAEERKFWESHDTVEYVDWTHGRWAAFPNLKPSTETISLRLPGTLLANLKILANKRDVPYQSLLKVFLAERVAQEQAGEGSAGTMPTKPFEPTPRRRRGSTA
jgi:predicted DNA binding CopG/RHH family protein